MNVVKARVIDSHTGGEPTRVVLSGGPDLGRGSLVERREIFRTQHDEFRCGVILEPRGRDVLVGALLLEPSDPACLAGVIFFDNAGFLGMCGHGMIGLITTLEYLGRIGPGEYRIETPAGVVTCRLHADGSVSVVNVPAHRRAKATVVEVPGLGRITGDVAYGGNWFFLVDEHGQHLDHNNVETLTDFAWRTRLAVNAQGFPEVDHVILYDRTRNFVLCPGKAYDRSPCGTGTSARLACLAADGKLAEGETHTQQSIIGSEFRGTFRWLDRERGVIEPTITGTAHVTGETTLLFHGSDPYAFGIR